MSVEIKKNASGMFELYKDGSRVSTGTEQAISQMANNLGGSAGATPTTTKTDPIASSGIRRHITPRDPLLGTEIGNLDRTAPTTGEENNIREQEFERVQASIDNINEVYAGLVSREEVAGAGRQGQTRSISARSGNLGQDFGAQAKEKTTQFNKGQIESLNAQKMATIDAVLSKATDRADKKIEAERNLNQKNQELYFQFQAEKIKEARADVKDLAKAGVSLNDISDEEYKSLLEDTEMQPFMFEAVYNANLPANEKQEYSYINVGGSKIVRVNKAGGEPEEFDFSTPEGFVFKMAGDTPVFINEETQEIKIANPEGEDLGAFSKETELDTFTDADGNRVSVMYNPTTKKTRQIVLGKVDKKDSGDDEFGEPTASEKSKAKTHLLNKIKDLSKDRQDFYLKQLEDDQTFFAETLKEANMGL